MPKARMELRMFVVEQGFREGWHGFVLSSLTACSMFCVYAKVWEQFHLANRPDVR